MGWLPSQKQWRTWSLPSKLTALGTLLGLLSFLGYLSDKAYDGITRYLHSRTPTEFSIPDLALELTNTTNEPIALYPRGDLVLWLPQGVKEDIPHIPGKYELIPSENEGSTSVPVIIPASSKIRINARLLGKPVLAPILNQGTADLELIFRKELGGIIFSGSIPFTKEALQSTRWQVAIGGK